MKNNRRIFLIVAMIFFCMSFVYLGKIHLPAQTVTKGKPPKPVPEQPALILAQNNIVTVERGGNGRLAVWGNFAENDYQNLWSYEIRHSSVAIGDVDNDPATREIVAPHGVKITEGKGKKATSYNRIFLHVYKEGEPGVWRTTYASNNGSVTQSSTFALYEITIADVDNNPGNEIVIITTEWLLIYQYDADLDHFIIIGSFHKTDLESVLFPNSNRILTFHSVAVGDINTDLNNEIVVSANVFDENGWVENLGYLFTFQSSDLESPTVTEIDAKFSYDSLCFGDMDGDGNKEICVPGYKMESNGLYQGYILVWDDVNYIPTKIAVGLPTASSPSLHLDVGDINSATGEEIVVMIGHPERKLIIYNMYEGELNSLVLPDIFIHVKIADSDSDGENEIIGSGVTNSLFYLVVFDNNLQIEWEYKGDRKSKEYEIWDADVG